MREVTKAYIRYKTDQIPLTSDLDEDFIHEVSKILVATDGKASPKAQAERILKITRLQAIKRGLWLAPQPNSGPHQPVSLPDWAIELPDV